MITAEITLREALSGNKEGLLSSPPPLGFCFLLCWQNKPMKYEYFPSDKPLSKRSCSAGMTLTPGGGEYRQLLYPVMAYTDRSWWNWRSSRTAQHKSVDSNRDFQMRKVHLIHQSWKFHHTSFGSVQGLNNDIFCVSIRSKFLFVEAKLDFLARRTVQRFAAIDRKVAAFLKSLVDSLRHYLCRQVSSSLG